MGLKRELTRSPVDSGERDAESPAILPWPLEASRYLVISRPGSLHLQRSSIHTTTHYSLGEI